MKRYRHFAVAYTVTIGLAFSALLLGIPPARAGWQKTEWGMTLQQVERIVPGKLRGPFNGAKQSVEFIAKARFKANGTLFAVSFWFDPNRLIEVVLTPVDTPKSCKGVETELRMIYGPPEQRKKQSELWRDRRHDNLIIYDRLIDVHNKVVGCDVLYDQIPKPQKGL